MKDKKYVKVLSSGKKVYYGDPNYRIAPSTPRGDSYCARSYGQLKMYPSAAKNPNSPLRLSREKWLCRGKKSIRQ